MLRGVSNNLVVDSFAENFVETESLIHTFTWFSRVTSTCNVADHPSRGVTSIELLRNACNVSDVAKVVMDGLVAQLSTLGEKGCAPSP